MADDVFAVLNYPWQILHTPTVAGNTNPSTGMWQPPVTAASVAITGSIQDITARALKMLPEGEYEIGDRRISTGAALNNGDILQVTEFDSSITTWTVKTRERTSYIMQKVGLPLRHTYLLKRRV